jgi:hypothetical protein
MKTENYYASKASNYKWNTTIKSKMGNRVMTNSQTKEPCISKRIIEKFIDDNYVWSDENGNFQYDPSGNQLLDELRAIINKDETVGDGSDESKPTDLSEIPF